MHFKFTSVNELEPSAKEFKKPILNFRDNHMTQKHELEPATN